MSDVMYGPKGGELMFVEDVPYELRAGLKMEDLKAKMDGHKGFRCRRGWHAFEFVGEPATLAMIEKAPAWVEATSLVGRVYSNLKQCTRCGELGRHFR